MIVPRIHTPVPLAGLVGVLHDACHTALGQCPGFRDVVALAMLEEEHGVTDGALRAVYGYNLGNRDAAPSAATDPAVRVFQTVLEAEGSGLHTWSARHLREAYAGTFDGCIGFWLALTGRYIGAWEVMVDAQGNPAPRAFAESLGELGYFTGSVEAYASALERIVARMRGST